MKRTSPPRQATIFLIAAALLIPIMAAAGDAKPEDSPQRDFYAGLRLNKNIGMWISHSSPMQPEWEDTHRTAHVDFGAMLGAMVNDNMRLEAEIDYSSVRNHLPLDGRTDNFNATTVMGNFYYGRLVYSDTHPYMGLGMGLSVMDAGFDFDSGAPGISSQATDFSYQLTLGVLFNLTNRFDLDIGLRWRSYGTVKHPGPDYVETYADALSFYAGATFKW